MIRRLGNRSFVSLAFLKSLMTALSLTTAQTASAQSLDVPVMETADGDFDTCAYGKVAGLSDQGDGFLAVRSGPGTSYRKLDEIHNDDDVWLFSWEGDWIGIVYDAQEISCSPISNDREVPYEGKKGWVHKKWIRMIAG